MDKKLGALALAALILGLMFGCGPEQTLRQAEEQERDAVTREQKAYLAPFEGDYVGYMDLKDSNGKRFEVRLMLRTFSTFQPVAGRLEVIEIPSMVGYIEIGSPASNIRNGFNSSAYDPKTGVLKLLGQRDDSTVAVYMELRWSGDALVGELFRGSLAEKFELKRKVR